MMKIEVVMYVKKKNGRIGKILEIDERKHCVDNLLLDLKNSIYDVRCGERNIRKSSFNIIDLIEEGDYVNGDVVIVKYELNELSEGVLAHVITRSGKHIFEDDIVSIVTKEQFENASYKIGV